MTERLTVRVSLFDDDEMEIPLVKAVEWLSSALATVPAEYRDAAVFRIEMDHDYYGGSSSLTVDAYYDRPETDAEVTARLSADEASKRRSREINEANERAIYERLKSKYG